MRDKHRSLGVTSELRASPFPSPLSVTASQPGGPLRSVTSRSAKYPPRLHIMESDHWQELEIIISPLNLKSHVTVIGLGYGNLFSKLQFSNLRLLWPKMLVSDKKENTMAKVVFSLTSALPNYCIIQRVMGLVSPEDSMSKGDTTRSGWYARWYNFRHGIIYNYHNAFLSVFSELRIYRSLFSSSHLCC